MVHITFAVNWKPRCSLYEPNKSMQAVYNCELNKTGQLNGALKKFNSSHKLSEIVIQSNSLRRVHAGVIVKGVCSINASTFHIPQLLCC